MGIECGWRLDTLERWEAAICQAGNSIGQSKRMKATPIQTAVRGADRTTLERQMLDHKPEQPVRHHTFPRFFFGGEFCNSLQSL
jgi:hypothetical protein